MEIMYLSARVSKAFSYTAEKWLLSSSKISLIRFPFGAFFFIHLSGYCPTSPDPPIRLPRSGLGSALVSPNRVTTLTQARMAQNPNHITPGFPKLMFISAVYAAFN
jgi:hypothetical protein